MTAEERFERLEKSLRQWRMATVTMIGLLAVVLFSGAADRIPAELTVRRLTVVDENGSPCITLLRKSAIDFTGIVMEQHPDGGEATGGSVAIVTSKESASLRLSFGSQVETKGSASLVVNGKGDRKLTFSDGKTDIQFPPPQ